MARAISRARALETGAGRLIHVSSIVAYGLHGGVITEETPDSRTTSPIKYVRSKALAEREIRKAHQPRPHRGHRQTRPT